MFLSEKINRLKVARDVISRTGHSLALGCLHRYVGGIGSGQHLRMSVAILLALSRDFNSPEVQVGAFERLFPYFKHQKKNLIILSDMGVARVVADNRRVRPDVPLLRGSHPAGGADAVAASSLLPRASSQEPEQVPQRPHNHPRPRAARFVVRF